MTEQEYQEYKAKLAEEQISDLDAEIERLKEQSKVEMSGIWLLKNQITDLRKAIMEKSAEIERLKANVESARVELRQQWERMQKENLALKDRVNEKDNLITELADALEDCGTKPYIDLKHRAREATR